MKKVLGSLRRVSIQMAVFLAVLGPGLVTAVADNDAGGVATYTVAASMYGMGAAFLLLPEIFLLGLSQTVGSRIALVTRKGLGDLIREKFGLRISVLIFSLYFIANQGVVLQNVAGLKSSLRLLEFPFPWRLSLLLVAVFLIGVVILLDYQKLQRIFLVMILFYFTYVISALLIKPDWKGVFFDAFVYPRGLKINLAFIFSRLAVLGTTITAWGQFFIQSYTVDKDLTKESLRYSSIGTYASAIITNLFSLMIVIAVTGTLFKRGIIVQNAQAAALAIKPLAGQLTYALFSTGLLGASILGLTIVPLATAYAFTEFFGYEGSLDVNLKKGKIFYFFFTLQIMIAFVITLLPGINLFKITLYVDFLNAALLPIIFYFLIKFSEDVELMGDKTIGSFSRVFLRGSTVVILLSVVALLVGILGRTVF